MPRTRTSSLLASCLLLIAAARAQEAPAVPAPVNYASASELKALVSQIQLTSQNIQADLGKTRIEKWKLDSGAKHELQSNAESILRNLQSALPEILGQLNNAPEDLSASFKLYRNLDALYDVFGPIAESAGAFGSKDEFQQLSNDMNGLQSVRRALGERMQNLASAKEGELSRLRSQVKALQASAAPPAPPKKIVVDDTEPVKKPVKKKAAKPATQTPTATTPPPPSTPK